MAQVRLLGPDLPTPLVLSVEPSMTVAELKAKAVQEWPGGGDPPQVAQLKVILLGRFLPDDKPLRDFKVVDGETAAMHIIVKDPAAKGADAPGSSDEKTPKCSCVIC